MKIRPVSVLLSLAFACGDRGGAARPAIEAPITRELATRFGGPATVTCAWIGTVAVGCRATFVDGAALVIAIAGHEWRVAGRAFATAPIVAYVRAELAELGKPDTVDCGPSVHAGVEPFSCVLSGGGAAFVDIGPTGVASIELELDPAIAAIRAEAPHDSELARRSRALDIPGEDEDDGKPVK